MDQKEFEALLILIVPQVVHLIAEQYAIHEIEASKAFYESEVYDFLEKEETKLWHLSPMTLYHMFDEEKKTGRITFPEE